MRKLTVALFLAGCASLQNTPAQERVLGAYQACKAETGSNAVLQQVYPDGRYTALCSDKCVRWPELVRCISERS